MLVFISTPFQAQAGLFSLIMGDDARADTVTTISNPTESSQTSGTMAILQTNLSASVLEDKSNKQKDDKDNKADGNQDSQINANATVHIVSDSAMLSAVGPMGIYNDEAPTGGSDFSSDEISFYVVHPGDSISVVAEMFGVTPDTIYSANNMQKGDKLKPGEVLLILPFSGVEYTVVKGDTPLGIANRYKVSLDEILIHNDMDINSKLTIGEKLLIPGASMQNEVAVKSSSGSGTVLSGRGSSSMPSVAGYFKNPVPSGRRSRGVTSSHRGVDIAAPTGTPIYAAASGTVLIARNGNNGGFGIYVVVQHPNGVKTLYAHMSKLGTDSGAQVSQGDVIGYVGSTGRSTGPHLHFETIGAKNPF